MNDNIIQIEDVEKTGVKLLISVTGKPGAGKSMTALYLALGLAGGNPKKVGFLDIDSDRGKLYHNAFGDGKDRKFRYAPLHAPFSPDRHIKAVKQFEEDGVEVLVIDGVSPLQDEEGGLIWIAENNKRKNAPNYLLAKQEYKKFVSYIRRSKIHLIFTAKSVDKQIYKGGVPVGQELTPICEKSFMFEMIIHLNLSNNGTECDFVKLPGNLSHIFTESGHIGEREGMMLREYAGDIDNITMAKRLLEMASTFGSERLKEAWINLPNVSKEEKETLIAFKNTLKDAAKLADDSQPVNGNRETPEEDDI